MDQIMHAPMPAHDGLAIELAAKAIKANADYNLLVRMSAAAVERDAGAERAIDRSLSELNAACVALAAVATTTLAGQRAKASVLLVAARASSAGWPETEDNTGLTFSLLEDIIGRENLACGTTLIDDVLNGDGHSFSLKPN